MTGTLEKGKAFATTQAIERLSNTLELSIAEDPRLIDNIETNWPEVVRRSPLVKNSESLIYDGWGTQFNVTIENGVITIRSQNLEEYYRKEGR